MRITKRLLGILTVTGFFLLGGTAQAGSIVDFAINPTGSSVSVTSSGFGGVDAALALSDSSFSLGEGETKSFDFITWTPSSNYGGFVFNVSATLAFAEPLGLEPTSSGGGLGLVLNGNISYGVLEWDDVPATVELSDGTTVQVDFQGGVGIFAGSSITTTASVTLVSAGGVVGAVGSGTPMPEPSSAALLGIGGLLVARRLRSNPR